MLSLSPEQFFLSVDDLEEDMQPVDEEGMISIPIETLMKFIAELPAGYRTTQYVTSTRSISTYSWECAGIIKETSCSLLSILVSIG